MPRQASVYIFINDRKDLELAASILKGFKPGFLPPLLLSADHSP